MVAELSKKLTATVNQLASARGILPLDLTQTPLQTKASLGEMVQRVSAMGSWVQNGATTPPDLTGLMTTTPGSITQSYSFRGKRGGVLAPPEMPASKTPAQKESAPMQASSVKELQQRFLSQVQREAKKGFTVVKGNNAG